MKVYRGFKRDLLILISLVVLWLVINQVVHLPMLGG